MAIHLTNRPLERRLVLTADLQNQFRTIYEIRGVETRTLVGIYVGESNHSVGNRNCGAEWISEPSTL